MSQDVFELVKQLDTTEVETQMALQCAPFIMGLRISNLFVVSKDKLCELYSMLQKSKIHYMELVEGSTKMTMFLYNEEDMLAYMSDERVLAAMTRMGYQNVDFHEMLYKFKDRYKAYMAGEGDFPHEMGFFLGYPYEDVVGYIMNNGKNSLLTGYWKVYDNVSKKAKLFQGFETAKDMVIRYIAAGLSIPEIRLG